MKSDFNDGILTIYLEGNIDTSNAEETGTEIDNIRSCYPDSKGLTLDMESLKYISSAGLRQILRLKKRVENFKIINVGSDVYEIFDMTGFTDMMEIHKGFRKVDVTGCTIIGEGSNGIVYRLTPEIVVKVDKGGNGIEEIERERKLARKALVLGVNTAIPFDTVRVGDRFGSVFELLNVKSFSKHFIEDPEHLEENIKQFADFLREIHALELDDDTIPSAKETALRWVEFDKDYIDEEHFIKLQKLFNDLPDTNNFIHGDYHSNNVYVTPDGPLIIDMDTLSRGHSIIELGSVYNAYVGFGLADPHVHVEFMKMETEMVDYIWKKFLQFYYQKEDTELEENRAKIVGLTRLLRRTIRRDSENKALIEISKRELCDAIDKVDSLF